ncbi:DMT family transporter [Ornithinibacillus sp. 4-3]|uniref:DMT family transporter n=1 Tax=Ornithinibacillus sp. 4-3 TaxID=3231488 RepID=A0AB39HUB5_9BACI
MTRTQANLILVTITISWGTSYIFMKMAADTMSAFSIVALRFGIAFILMFLLFYKKMLKVDRRTLQYSFVLGALLAATFIVFIAGVRTTSASVAGFLTSTTVMFVPLFQMIITRKLPVRKIRIAVLLAFIGLLLFSIKGDFSLSTGALLCLAGAAIYGVYIIVTNKFAKEVDAFVLGIYQLGFTGVIALMFVFIAQTPLTPPSKMEWIAVLGLAIICTAYGTTMQPVAQKYTTAENTGFIFALEPLFAAGFAFILLNETLTGQEYIGAAFILISVLIANYTPREKKVVSTS